MISAQDLTAKLDELIQNHGIPGAQLAVLDGDTIVEAAAGVTSLRTGLATTPDALFQAASIGKLYTATLVMMLVDEGKLDLETPIRAYLPGFRTQDPQASEIVTLRHLLCHTSGFDGDHFTDTGRGDDALARYVEGCEQLPQIADPGKIWSYSNSGYAILGRVVEVITGETFESVLRDRIFVPFGLERTVSFADEAIVHHTAVGHVPDPKDAAGLVVSPTWSLARAFGPMGGAVIASAGDVLRFATVHLDGGVAADGTRVLDADLVAAMQQEQVQLLDQTLGEAWGLGWILDRWGDVVVIGHDGNWIGQNAFMRIAPEQQFGFCLQTNVGSAMGLYREVASWLFEERLGVQPTPSPKQLKNLAVVDPARYVGAYEREGLRFEVSTDESRCLRVTVTPTHPLAEAENMPPMVDLPLRPIARDDSFLLKLPIADVDLPAVFFDPDSQEGEPTYVHFGGRAKRRVP